MHFDHEPTARADRIAEYLREWYERNRESWWDRHRPQLFSYRDNSGIVADEFMLRLVAEVNRIQDEANRQTAPSAQNKRSKHS